MIVLDSKCVCGHDRERSHVRTRDGMACRGLATIPGGVSVDSCVCQEFRMRKRPMTTEEAS